MKLSPQAESLLAAPRLDRRGFVRSALGSVFAAAVLPVSAQTVSTPHAGLEAGEAIIDSSGFGMPVYVARPQGKSGNLPVVLVISEVFGVHEHIADICRRFAHAGYLAIAPELFARHGDPTSYGTIQELITQLINKVPDAEVLGDLDACVRWASDNGGDRERIGMTGFCWGGRITWLFAAHIAALKAGVAWYGRLTGETNVLQPRHPLAVAGALKVPVLGLYGAKDAGIPLDHVEQMQRALAIAGTPATQASRFTIYPEAPHAFHADYRPSYREIEARDGWRQCLAWFRQHGVR